MNDKDKQIVKDSLDTIVSSVPGLNVAWGLSKALYGAGLKLRQQRALEWVEMIRDNPTIFTKQILEQSEFQDGFVFVLEKYVTERNEQKREIIKRIFLGYANTTEREKFELERLISTLSLISYDGLVLLGLLEKLSSKETHGKMLSELLKDYLVKDSNDNPGKYNLKPNENIREVWLNAETDLISIGVLRTYNIARWGGKDHVSYPDYDLSKLGKEMIKYIKHNNVLHDE